MKTSKVQITETVVYEIEVEHEDNADEEAIVALGTSEFLDDDDKNQYLMCVEERLAAVVK